MIVAILLGLAVALTAWCTLGMLRARDPLDRMHFLTPVSTVATLLVALAIAIGGSGTSSAIKAMIVFAFTALTSPVTQHKIARAIWVRRHGRWQLPDREGGD